MHALISGFNSPMERGGLRGVSFEMSGVIVVAAVMESGEDEITEGNGKLMIDGGCSTRVGRSSSEILTELPPLLLLFLLLLNWHFLEVM